VVISEFINPTSIGGVILLEILVPVAIIKRYGISWKCRQHLNFSIFDLLLNIFLIFMMGRIVYKLD
jgi:hypothetical protein